MKNYICLKAVDYEAKTSGFEFILFALEHILANNKSIEKIDDLLLPVLKNRKIGLMNDDILDAMKAENECTANILKLLSSYIDITFIGKKILNITPAFDLISSSRTIVFALVLKDGDNEINTYLSSEKLKEHLHFDS